MRNWEMIFLLNTKQKKKDCLFLGWWWSCWKFGQPSWILGLLVLDEFLLLVLGKLEHGHDHLGHRDRIGAHHVRGDDATQVVDLGRLECHVMKVVMIARHVRTRYGLVVAQLGHDRTSRCGRGRWRGFVVDVRWEKATRGWNIVSTAVHARCSQSRLKFADCSVFFL